VDQAAPAPLRPDDAARIPDGARSSRTGGAFELTSLERDETVRLLVISRMMLVILESNSHAASLVSGSFPAELRSMISASERHLAGLDD